MRYRVTFESGPSAVVDDVAQRHFLRQAIRAGHGRTRVRGGWVITLPGDRLVAMLRESTHGTPAIGIVSVDLPVS